MKLHRCVIGVILVLLISAGAYAQTFDRIKAAISEHMLPNGMKFIVLERHDAPVVSFHIYADAGAANEHQGITGISHLLEHMAFKGTRIVGTNNFDEEKKLLDQMDILYDEIKRENAKASPDTAALAAKKSQFEDLRVRAKGYVVNNELFDIFLREGDAGINAYTNNDATQYINSLPSNRLEFWMAVSSDRFMNPVFREFYKEKDVVMEERRLSLETQPIGKLIEDFTATAFKAHPYHHSVVGHMSDLESITHQDVKDYFSHYYAPSNLTAAVVGDVKASEVFRLAELYFGRIPSVPKPEGVRTVEPEQWGERRVKVEAESQPILLIGFHRPSVTHPDDAALEAMANIVGQGRSSWLYQDLVKEKKIAVQTGTFNGFPGNKFPNLVAFFAIPSQGHTSEECEKAILGAIEKLKTQSVTPEELTKYKRGTMKGLTDAMKSNGNMAALLTQAEAVHGHWSTLFDELKKVNAVTAEDVQRVARTTLVATHKTTGEIIPVSGK